MHPQSTHTKIYRSGPRAALCLFLFAVLAFAAPGAQAASCDEDGKNVQCNDLGYIAMDVQKEIRGDPIQVTINTTIEDTHAGDGARYLMFSVRHDAQGHESPVSLELVKFSSNKGTIYTDRIDHDIPNEINVWAHVADIPEDQPLQLVVNVGASERGAFRLETLVMAFDRGYDPLQEDGEEVTLFSFTTLGVNEETARVTDSVGTFRDRITVPGFGAMVALGALSVATVVTVRRLQR